MHRLGWLLSDLSKSPVVTVWWQAFHTPHPHPREIFLSTGQQQETEEGSSYQVCFQRGLSWIAPSFRTKVPQQKPMGRQASLVGKKSPRRAAALPHLPPQNLLPASSGNTILNFLASLTPLHRLLLLLCITQSTPNYPWVVYPGGW